MLAETQQLEPSITEALTLSSDGTIETQDDASLRVSLCDHRLGRYELLGVLGEGAMGVVFEAYDPRLERKVALKVPKPNGHRFSVSRNRRTQQEAQVLARIGHPNVVGIHDVGEHRGLSFFTMELVEGQTLTKWLAASDGRRPWAEILAVFVAVGRGLVAIHEVGLVHRDFKPDNVMVDDQGHVRLMDFGLARHASEQDQDEGAEPGSGAEPRVRGPKARLTQTGAVMGTPAYMSFEQFEGIDVDARADQFSFCVALYEALYGAKPFAVAGDTLVELLTALEAGVIREAPANTLVPDWLRQVILRGLAHDPDARWPSMKALLDALAAGPTQPSPTRPRRRWAMALAMTLGLIFTKFAGMWATEGTDTQLERDTASAVADERIGQPS